MPKALEPDLARLYHLNSSTTRSKTPNLDLDESRRPAKRRLDPGAERLPLPGRDFDLAAPLGATLAARRSRRDLQLSPLPLETLGRLLFLSFGIAGRRELAGFPMLDRPFPSAGGLYPLELYVVAQEVTDLPDGIYHYDPWTHELARRRGGRFHTQLAGMAFGQEVIGRANLVLCLTAIFARTTWKYGQRGYRYVLFEAGHVNHNFYLIATALGLSGFAVGGFFDREVSGLLELQAEEEDPLYLFCAGQEGG